MTRKQRADLPQEPPSEGARGSKGDARLVFRTPLWHRLMGVGGFLLGAVLALGPAPDSSGIIRGLGIAVGVVLVGLAWRFWLLRIEAGPEGVRIVNWRDSTQLKWGSIQRFSWDVGFAVLMRDGSEHHADIFSPWVLPITGHFAYLAPAVGRQLQDELRRRHKG